MKLLQYKVLPIVEQRNFLPKWLSNGAIGVYFSLLLIISMLFMNYAMEWYFMFIGAVEVVGFFFLANILTKRWSKIVNARVLHRSIFGIALSVRIFWVFFSYLFYIEMTGSPFEFSAADSLTYNNVAQVIADNIWSGNGWEILRFYSTILKLGDSGFPLLLSVCYFLLGKSVLLSRIIRCLIGAYTCILVYRFSDRNFGHKVAKIATALCVLNPLLYHYGGMELKETELTFLVVLFLERGDSLIRLEHFNLRGIIEVVLIGLSLFLFRTVLGVLAIFAILFSMVFTSSRIVSWGRRIVLAVVILGLVGAALSNRIKDEVTEITETDVLGQQQLSMEKRYGGAAEKGKNELAKYAGAAVFAPLIFTLPFPTMVATPSQQDMRLIHSGNYIKNVLSGFVIFAMFILLLSGDWRKCAFPLALLLGYLLVLTVSQFAHSVRFHIPIIPIEMIFAAYGITQLKPKQKVWFDYWLVFVFVANIGWAWFKLKGRGAI